MLKSIFSTGTLIAIIGLIMVISPETSIKLAVILLGIAGIVNGVYNLVSVRSLVADRGIKRLIGIRGFLSILIGLVAIILPLFLAGMILYTMVYMLASYLILSAVLEIIATSRMKKEGVPIKMFTVEIISSFILAAILFAIPAAADTILRIIGVVLVVLGVGFVIWEWRNQAHNKTQ